jgi:serine/threonine-protein phosphatase 2A regulatory subunit B
VLTGSYHNYFRIYDTDTLSDVVLQADKSAFKAKKIGGPLPGAKAGAKNGPRPGGLRDAMQLDTLDFNKKILHASWHPRENTIAVSLVSSQGDVGSHAIFVLDCCYEQFVPL